MTRTNEEDRNPVGLASTFRGRACSPERSTIPQDL